ncbi:UDP-glucosyltransferase 2-like [Epargyreus clarus]|uniref:UDP-glucosyltransferase 2-like n=1 Tax=Epargyreus clarus TaxID=520877 RepID=UPI003C2C322E
MASRTSMIGLIFLLTVSLNEALRILVFFPMASKSHSILGDGVVRNLLEAGHEVVHITSFPSGKPHPRLKEINVGDIGEKMREDSEKYDAFKLKNLVGKHHSMTNSLFVFYFAYDFHKQVYNHKAVSDFLSDPKEHFDTVIVEWFFSDYSAGLAPLFKCPLIWIGSTEAHWQVLRLIDEIPNPAYSVDLFSDNRAPLSLSERISEMWTLVEKYLIVNLILVPFEWLAYNSIFTPLAAKRGVTMPSYTEAVYNGSMLLLNSHPSIGTAFRLPQNAKYIAGYHIDPKVQALPKDLQKLMDGAKNGVIYFSMGSNLKSADMSDAMRDSLLEMFGKLEQTVLWKFETGLKKIPPNVHLLSWAPQQSIFSHPNLKLFISHGGQLSTTEAIHFGVPVIGIPVLGDQHFNMKAVEDKGFGIKVKLAEDMAGNLNIAIRKMLSNPSYKARAKQLSAWYHNRLKTPGEEMVHWIEYTVATDGAPHLKSPALHVPCYQKLHLDVIAILVIILTVLVTCVRRLYRWWKGSKVQNKKKTQ